MAHAQVVDTIARRDSAARLAAVEVRASRIAGVAATAPYALTVRTTGSLPPGTPSLALDDALRAIPGVQIDNRFNFALGERISIRGAGARAQFGVRGVRILIDGIPATLPDGQTTLNTVDPATISRVEVLRGPAASLYGNAAGGAVLIETTEAPRGAVGAEAAVTAGADDLRRVHLRGGGTHGGFTYAIGGSRLDYGGYRAHADARNTYASARAGWIGARDLVRLTFSAVDYDARNPGSLSDSLLRIDRTQAFRTNVAQRTGETGVQQQGGAQWRRTFGEQETELTTWLIGRSLDNPIPARVVVLDRLAGGLRALYRGAAGRFAWTAGAEREAQRDDRRNYVNSAGERGALVLDQRERVTGTGVFAQARAAMAPGVFATGGLRHDRTRFSADDRMVTSTDPDDSGSRTLSAVSPSLGLSWEAPRDLVLYASAGTAFETPTTTELVNRADGAGGFNPALEPQRTVSYEIGARRTAGSIHAALALYRSLVRDALIPFEVAGVAGRQFFRNAGRTATSGVEMSVSSRLSDLLTMDMAYTFTNARFRSYQVGTRSFDGNRVPGVAPHRGELTLTARRGRTWAGADSRYQSRTAVDDANAEHSPAYAVLDLRAGMDFRSVAVFAGVQNVFAAEYNSSVVVNAFGRRFFEPGPARTFHVGTRVRVAR